MGIVGIQDPPRPEVSDAVASAYQSGIRVIVITGDAPQTAMAIARDIGLEAGRSITGNELAQMSDEELDTALTTDPLFARTAPEHKLRVVDALQRRGFVVAMTGDGVNDAPALKKADVGVAMGDRGTDVARGAADMVLTDDNFASILAGVEEGRRQYINIQKFLRYLLTSNVGEVVAICLGIVLGGPLILLPVQILWMNLVTDGVTAVALGLEPAERDIMEQEPRDPRRGLLDRNAALITLTIGTYLGLTTLGLFFWVHQSDGLVAAQTIAFTGLVVLQKVNVFNFRSLRRPLAMLNVTSNPWLLLAVVVTLSLQLAAVYLPAFNRVLHTTPLDIHHWLMILAAALPLLAIPEALKALGWWRRRSRQLRIVGGEL